MKYAIVLFCLLASAIGCQQLRLPTERVTEPTAPAATAPDNGAAFFRDRLARAGEWMETAEYGPCWYPTEVGPAWRPYTNGRWVYTIGSGWLWVGDEKWGWATDHYGRWVFLDSHGWVWVPGKQWAPAWVVWRAGNGYIGWAPMPPMKAGEREIDVTRVDSKTLPPMAFTFVAEEFLADEKLAEHAEPLTRNVTLFERSEDATRYQMADGRFFNGGVSINAIDRVRGGADQPPIKRWHVVEINTLRPPELRGEDVLVYRPNLDDQAGGAAVLARMSSGPPQPPPRPREPTPELGASQREALDEYHRRLAEQMAKRHDAELAATPVDGRIELARLQNRERDAFEEQRQREVEALRRRQRDEQERFAARQPPPQSTLPGSAAPARGYEIPPEWQLPDDYMLEPPARPRRPPRRR